MRLLNTTLMSVGSLASVLLQWDVAESPPYSYWTYYLYANLTSLNKLRASKVCLCVHTYISIISWSVYAPVNANIFSQGRLDHFR